MWQPIETAPLDGTPILAFNSRHPTHAPVVVRYDFKDDEFCWVDAATASGEALRFNDVYFDYWMPIPPCPYDHGKGGENGKDT